MSKHFEKKTLKLVKSDFYRYEFMEGLVKERLAPLLLTPSAAFLGGGLYAATQGNPVMALTGVAISALLSFRLMLSNYKNKAEYEPNLVPNEEGQTFGINIGSHIKEHKENSVATLKAHDNVIKPILLTSEYWSRHGIICGTTGAGKTVFLQFITKQFLDQGGGFLFLNGKPDLEMKKEMFAQACMVGREQDFYYLDFNNKDNSMAMSVFDMQDSSILELLNFMLGNKAENEWGTKAVNLMSSLTTLFLRLKKEGLIFPYDEIKNIGSVDDLYRIREEKGYRMGFYILDSYLNTKRILDLIKVISELNETKEGKELFFRLSGNETKENFKQKPIHFDLVSSMEKLSNLDFETLTTKSFEQITKEGDDPFYSVGVAIDFWTDILKKFTQDYGEILDSSTPQININDIVRGHKMLYVSLPGTASQAQKEILGKIMVAQIKSAYERLQNASAQEIAFTIFLDEFNSWSKDIKGFGDLSSQTRSKRLAFYFLFQSSLKSMDDGKGLEGDQIFANANTQIMLKLEDTTLIKEFIEKCGKEEILQDTSNFQKRDYIDSSDKSSLEQNLQEKEIDKLKIEQIQNLSAGQGFVKIGSSLLPIVGGYFEPIRYETADPSGIVPSELRYPKEKFLREMERFLNNKDNPDIAA